MACVFCGKPVGAPWVSTTRHIEPLREPTAEECETMLRVGGRAPVPHYHYTLFKLVYPRLCDECHKENMQRFLPPGVLIAQTA